MNYTDIQSDEMSYIDGGLAISTGIALFTAWGASSWAAYYNAGVFTHNQGWARHGKAKLGFRAAAVVLWGIFGQAHFDIRFDNGWMAAKRNRA